MFQETNFKTQLRLSNNLINEIRSAKFYFHHEMPYGISTEDDDDDEKNSF